MSHLGESLEEDFFSEDEEINQLSDEEIARLYQEIEEQPSREFANLLEDT